MIAVITIKEEYGCLALVGNPSRKLSRGGGEMGRVWGREEETDLGDGELIHSEYDHLVALLEKSETKRGVRN